MNSEYSIARGVAASGLRRWADRARRGSVDLTPLSGQLLADRVQDAVDFATEVLASAFASGMPVDSRFAARIGGMAAARTFFAAGQPAALPLSEDIPAPDCGDSLADFLASLPDDCRFVAAILIVEVRAGLARRLGKIGAELAIGKIESSNCVVKLTTHWRSLIGITSSITDGITAAAEAILGYRP